jgi:flagellar assembly factor FliW
MPITLESSRFGPVRIDPASVLEFPEGLIGLRGSRYALLATKPESPFSWLHSLEDPALALPVANPHHFFPGYRVEMADGEAERLGLSDVAGVDVLVTVRAARDPSEFAVNLRAPILLWNGRGHQVLNHAPGVQLRAPLFGAPAHDHGSAT